ncbi:hypothetical protein BD779DRAFT_1476002 [Infundibulicybe gibba]|nr:hypothetical protein BD779DRAFT_1476002 [Infundibulicybe gibba]
MPSESQAITYSARYPGARIEHGAELIRWLRIGSHNGQLAIALEGPHHVTHPIHPCLYIRESANGLNTYPNGEVSGREFDVRGGVVELGKERWLIIRVPGSLKQ